jgi:transcriptional regulator with XRE-family HTH domain
MIPDDIHLKIRAVRRDMDLSQDYVAKKLGVEQQTISDIELGKKPVDNDLLIKISTILGVPKEHILSKEYIQPIQINNTNCTGNVGCNHVTITNESKIIEEVKEIFEKTNKTNVQAFEEILVKIFNYLKKKGD